jgi:tRNA(Arg) A34 adenosine deaminase TadA
MAIDINPINSSKIASAVVIKRDIISLGQNQMKSHPFQFKYRKKPDCIFLHSEISAIKSALNHIPPSSLRRSTLYIHRVKRLSSHNHTDWRSGHDMPCSGCTRAIVEFDIRRVVYSTDIDGEFGEYRRVCD